MSGQNSMPSKNAKLNLKVSEVATKKMDAVLITEHSGLISDL
jgi:hypothetical protein